MPKRGSKRGIEGKKEDEGADANGGGQLPVLGRRGENERGAFSRASVRRGRLLATIRSRRGRRRQNHGGRDVIDWRWAHGEKDRAGGAFQGAWKIWEGGAAKGVGPGVAGLEPGAG